MNWLQIAQTLGIPTTILAGMGFALWRLAAWAKPHADAYMSDIRANSLATRELVKTLEATQTAMSHQMERLASCQEALARSDHRTSRAFSRMANVLESRPCIGKDGVRNMADSDQLDVDAEDSSSG